MNGFLFGIVFDAIVKWLSKLIPGQKTTGYPAEHLPDGHPDAAPPHPKRTPKYPVDTRPGAFNRDTGTYNP